MASGPPGYICGCFFTENIFIWKYNIHVKLGSRETFYQDNKVILEKAGCVSQLKLQEIESLAISEVERRQHIDQESVKRMLLIKQHYRPLHPDLYTLKEEFFTDEFLQLHAFAELPTTTFEDLADRLKEYAAFGVYSFPLFKKTFCDRLLEELDHFETSPLPKGRPNTMNNFGVLLNELGFNSGFFDSLRDRYLLPIARLLFPDWVGASRSLDSQRPFVVSYRMGEDRDLAWHYDDAEVTLNVCLGRDFADGELEFGAMAMDVQDRGTRLVSHTLGVGILHCGRQLHCARPISSGERHNLIVWMRSSSIRSQLCALCSRKPQLVKVEGFGAGFVTSTPSDSNWSTMCRTI